MPILPEDEKEYTSFLQAQVEQLDTLNFSHDAVLWHYTDGNGLLGIIQSGTLYATQVSCLNDSTEIRYAASLFKSALMSLLSKYSNNNAAESFVNKYLRLMEEEPERPAHAPSPFFVSCFSEQEDDLPQWRSYCGGENGYAIGFVARTLFGVGPLVRVNYDGPLHQKLATEIADATVKFFLEGLEKKRAETADKWAEEFLTFWDPFLTRLAPMVKDPGFGSEKEYRIIHEFTVPELKNMCFVQKKTMMSRHIALSFPLGGEAWVPRLPIAKILVGPCRHREITRISVDTLLRKMGYGGGKVYSSKRPFQET